MARPNPGLGHLWFQALNPLIYSAAVIPVVVGSAAAYHEAPAQFRWGILAWVLAGEVLLQAWLNITNDIWDAETGVDRDKPTSLVNLTGRPGLLHGIAWSCLAAGLVCIGVVNQQWPGNTVLWIALAGLGFGYAYQGPPFRLSYLGLGEPMTFLAFGPLATLAASYAQLGRWSWASFWASLLVGCWVTGIIFAHHFPQYETDKAHGKRSPVVRLGPETAGRVFPVVIAPAYVLMPALLATGELPWGTALVFLSLPLAWHLLRVLWTEPTGPAGRGATPLAVALHGLGGLLLSLGLGWG